MLQRKLEGKKETPPQLKMGFCLDSQEVPEICTPVAVVMVLLLSAVVPCHRSPNDCST